MTLGKLHNLLTKLIDQGHGRKKICIDKSTFNHPLEEDGAVIMEVHKLEMLSYTIIDDDGFTKERKDGTPCRSHSLVLYGKDILE